MKETSTTQAKRNPVNYRYDSLNWDFIKALAILANYAGTKYGYPENYAQSRLEENKSPINHIAEHFRQYLVGEPHDHFQDPRFHLVAIAYNAMMEFYYHTQFGHKMSLLVNPAGAKVDTNATYVTSTHNSDSNE